MVSEKALLGTRYKFKHIQIKVLEKDENDNVLVFAAIVVTTKLPDEPMSKGHIEINQTLWMSGSSKRPPGYWVLGSPEKDGVMTSVFASNEWLENTPKEIEEQKRAEWGLS